jgi:hypothetical protein
MAAAQEGDPPQGGTPSTSRRVPFADAIHKAAEDRHLELPIP